MKRISFRSVFVIAFGVTSGAVGLRTALTQPIWRPAYPPTTQQAKEWNAHEAIEAKKFGTTLEEFRAFEKRLGPDLQSWLIYDRKTDFGVWYELNGDGSAKVINVSPSTGKRLKASVEYDLGDLKTPGRVIYSGVPSGLLSFSEADHYAIWIDLNADGVFDQLMIPEKHNDLLNLDKGTYILVNSEWSKSVGITGITMDREVLVGNVRYDFDPVSGRWVDKNRTR